MAGSCAGLLILQLFVETRSLRNDRTLPAANFQLVAIRVLEEKRIVARTVVDTDFRPFERLAPRFAHQLRQPIHFVARIRPKRDPRSVWLMVLILRETEKFRRPVATGRIKRMEISAGHFSRRRLIPFPNKPKLWQKFSVELHRHLHVFYPQVDVIKKTRLHFVILNWFESQFNR